MAPRRSLALPLDWLALGIALLAIGAMWLSGIEGFTFGNDPQYDLGTGFHVAPDDPFLKSLEAGAVQNCPPDDKRWCPHYQELIHSDLFFNYPIYASFGRSIAVHPGEPFAVAAGAAAMGAVTLGFCAALALFILVSAALPSVLRVALAALFLASAPAAIFGHPTNLHELDIATSITWPRLAILGAGVVAIILAARLPVLDRLGDELRRRFSQARCQRLAIGGGVLVLVALAGRILLADPMPVWLLGLAGFAALIAVASILARTGAIIGVMIGLVLFLLIGPHYFFSLVSHSAPRGNLFLVTAPLLAYLAYRPNGRLVLLLPVLALLHVSVTGLIASALFLVELIACAWQRKPTVLLVVAASVTVAARLYSGLVFTAFGAGTDIATTLRAVLASDRWLPGMLFAAALAAAALYLLAQRDARWHAAGRSVLLVAFLAAIGQVPPILDLAGYTFFDPGLTAIILAPGYLAPAVAISAVLVLIGSLAGLGADNKSREGIAGESAILAIAAVALLAVVRVDTRAMPAAEWASSLARGAAQLASGHGDPDPRRDPLFARLIAGDDRYFLRTAVTPMNDPITYLSLLKYKVRQAAGLFDPSRATIENIDGNMKENQPERPQP